MKKTLSQEIEPTGYTVTEAAFVSGVSRETMNNWRLNKKKKKLFKIFKLGLKAHKEKNSSEKS